MLETERLDELYFQIGLDRRIERPIRTVKYSKRPLNSTIKQVRRSPLPLRAYLG